MDLIEKSGQIQQSSQKKEKWVVPISISAEHTVNPIRRIIDQMKIEPNPDYEFISVSIGDPTIFGNLTPPQEAIDAVVEAATSGKCNGYLPAIGSLAAREAVAKFSSTPETPLTEKDVIMTSGGSEAVEKALRCVANPGDNVLIPNPGFSLYRTIAGSEGYEQRMYKLCPEKGWEVDLEQMESLIDEKTSCIIVNNPSNPCGSVFSKEHMLQIIAVAERHRLPIIADEIYAYAVFKDETFYPMASLSKTVPVLALGALSKRFLVPGWRLGWILIHDHNNTFRDVRKGLADLSTKTLGPCSLIEGALPSILANTPSSFFKKTIDFIETNADLCFLNLSMVPGLKPVKPRGAMYMMVGLDESIMKCFKDDLDFTQRLVSTMSVFCLPGSCFGMPNFFRMVLTPPEEMLRTACDRIRQFCSQFSTDSVNGNSH